MKALCRFGILLGNFMIIAGIIQLFTISYWLITPIWWITLGYCFIVAGGIFFPEK
jgi:hypothetical protein